MSNCETPNKRCSEIQVVISIAKKKKKNLVPNQLSNIKFFFTEVISTKI